MAAAEHSRARPAIHRAAIGKKGDGKRFVGPAAIGPSEPQGRRGIRGLNPLFRAFPHAALSANYLVLPKPGVARHMPNWRHISGNCERYWAVNYMRCDYKQSGLFTSHNRCQNAR